MPTIPDLESYEIVEALDESDNFKTQLINAIKGYYASKLLGDGPYTLPYPASYPVGYFKITDDKNLATQWVGNMLEEIDHVSVKTLVKMASHPVSRGGATLIKKLLI